ncbi:threonine/serine exporter family protein [Paeniglutamicibacter antarcticus]|uniref:Threonine/serine exporter family protein n=1 Tax=Arthrobacter terrae TaxID=2935737 RepID=A0A931G536_9MICC|nr:threonine/serine exporter family protein [Arthrobacter terrae]MBG0740396.1 threonine/serine exporter family protein [Arthrobacter terrae]
MSEKSPLPRRPVPHAGMIPLVPAAKQNYAARSVLRKLVQGEAPPTAPMSIVDRLAGSPYANPTIQVGGVDASARKTIDFALHLAETMFRYGAGALEVETSIIAVTAALGLRNIEVDITNQSVIINYAKKDATPITLLRVVRSWTNNYAGLSLVHELVTDIVSGGVGRDESYRRLETILRSPRPFPRWMVTMAEAGFAAIVVAVIGGTGFGTLVALLSSLLVGLLARTLGKWRVPDFFTTAASSFLVTAIALICAMLDVPLTPASVVTGGILLLLPSGRLVSAVQDAINGFPVTAAGRFLSAFLTFGAIVSGIAVGLVFGSLFRSGRLDVTQPFSGGLPLWAALPLVILASVAIGIAEQTKIKLLLPTGLIGLLGYCVLLLATAAGLGDRFAPAVAAVVVGMAARFVALRMGAPQLVIAVPASIFLLVGLSIFRAMFVMTITPAASVEGAVGLFNALIIILAVAAGVVLGDNLARPLTRGHGNNEKRHNRRR